MTRILILSAFIISLVSCNNNASSSSKDGANNKDGLNNSTLYIKTVTVTGTGSNENRKEKITAITTDYFEVGLEELANDSGYSAQKTITEPTSMENFKLEFFSIVDVDGKDISFKTTTEFLNYMAGHGYEMVDQTKKRYGTDYTFKRK